MPRTTSFRSRTTPGPLPVHFSKSGPGVVQAEISEQRPGLRNLNSRREGSYIMLTGTVLCLDARSGFQSTFAHFLLALLKIEFGNVFSSVKVVQQK